MEFVKQGCIVLLAALCMARTGAVAMAAALPAEHALAKAEWFAVGGIGYAGTTSPEEKTFRGLLQQPDAVSALKELLRSGNGPAQCYALLGLRLLHDPAYQENIARYKAAKAQIKTVSGCIVMEQPVSNIVANIDRGLYDDALQRPVH